MLPDKKCHYILEKLQNAGFEAYLVGGCVRDMIMERPVHDFDITTNALPEQIIEVFSGDKVIPTGLKHGTVTVIHEHEPFEITTYRIDGEYSDSRRPDSVSFTTSLTDDLARRDFTVNAIAMDISGNIRDPFGGVDDINAHVIRCVGDPERRFTEDALRIVRAVRFASVLDFTIDDTTAEAALNLRSRLDLIAVERIRAEFVKLLCGCNVVEVLMKYRDLLTAFVPEIAQTFDFNQYSRYHKYDVYEHTARAVGAIPIDDENADILRTTMFFHDIGKPAAFTYDEKGFGHFKGHAGVGAEMARTIMKRLKFDNHTLNTVCALIAHHSDRIEADGDIKHIISQYGSDFFFMLMTVKIADNSAKREYVIAENDDCLHCIKRAHELIDEGYCMTIKQLAINGKDLAELGFEGHAIGECLEELLDMVMYGETENSRESLLTAAKEMLR